MVDPFECLTDANFIMFAMKAYDNPHCMTQKEFEDDLKKTKYIKRLLNRYKETGELKERLILNHIMVLYNMFGPHGATRILFFKLEPDLYPELKTFLVYLNKMPDMVGAINGEIIHSSDIPINLEIAETLRKL